VNNTICGRFAFSLTALFIFLTFLLSVFLEIPDAGNHVLFNTRARIQLGAHSIGSEERSIIVEGKGD
jgi:hypothetical protein